MEDIRQLQCLCSLCCLFLFVCFRLSLCVCFSDSLLHTHMHVHWHVMAHVWRPEDNQVSTLPSTKDKGRSSSLDRVPSMSEALNSFPNTTKVGTRLQSQH